MVLWFPNMHAKTRVIYDSEIFMEPCGGQSLLLDNKYPEVYHSNM